MASHEADAGDTPLALLLAPPLSPAGDAACYSHLSDGGAPPQRSLAVCMTERPDDRLRGWRDHVGGVPDEAVVLASQRSADPPAAVEIVPIEDPGDLSWLGVRLTERLDAWPAGGRGTFCLDSLTALLQFVEEDPAIRFLETLRDHLDEAGVVGHVHLNPAAHEERTVGRLEALADAIIAVEDEEPAFPGT